MALIKCKECGKEISDKAKNCPHCGRPVSKLQSKLLNKIKKIKSQSVYMITAGLFLTFLIILIIVNFKNTNTYNSDNKVTALDVGQLSSTDLESVNSKAELALPDDLTDDQVKIITDLQGTWKILDNYSKIKTELFIFNGMQVQYFYKTDTYGTKSYTSDLKFIEKDGCKFLVETSQGSSNFAYLYNYNTNQFSINTYDDYDNDYFVEYSSKTCYKIDDDNKFLTDPQIGMTKEEVKNSLWGTPKDINKTTTVNGTSEQWVYDNYKYVYFDDDIVTSIQE